VVYSNKKKLIKEELKMKVIKCEKCGDIFLEDDGSVGDHRSFEVYLCAECSDEHKEEIRRYEGKDSVAIPS
jgi:formylmethanofuran dehydrogenase subunit E